MTRNTVDQLVAELEAAEHNLEAAEARKHSAEHELEREVERLIEEIDSYFRSATHLEKEQVWVYTDIPPGHFYERDMLDPYKGVWIKYDPDGHSSLLVDGTFTKGVVVYANLKALERRNELSGELRKALWLRSARQRWNYNTVKAWAEDVRQLHELVMDIAAGS